MSKNKKIDYLITQSEGAKILDVSNALLSKMIQNNPDYNFIEYQGRKKFINIKKSDWKKLVKDYTTTGPARKIRNKNISQSQTFRHNVRGNNINTDSDKEYNNNNGALMQKAIEADLSKKIYTAEIAKEKAKQEEIKTLELKKELAPFELIKHFFSFAENMIQRIYRRPFEISPEIEALYLSGESEKAIQKIIRELESIIKNSVKELTEEIKAEGFKVDE